MTKATAWQRDIVLAEGARRGWPSEELDSVIAIESRWDPAAINPVSNATGLIQFMPSTLRRLGWTQGSQAFSRLSADQQAPYVAAYFDSIGRRWSRPGDTYLAVAAAGNVGVPDERVIYPVGSKAWTQNPGWRSAGGGDITGGSIRAVLFRQMARGPMQLSTAGRPLLAGMGATSASLLGAALVLGGYWFWMRYRKGR